MPKIMSQRKAGEGAAIYQLTTANNRQLDQLLCSFSHGHSIDMIGRGNCLVDHNEAKITLLSYMLKFAKKKVRHVF